MKMHEGEVATDPALVRKLLAAQFPHWAGLPILPVASAGTDNALYRLGPDMVARLPRIDWAVSAVEKEQRWLPHLAPHLPLDVPVPLAKGVPGEGYPWPWSIYRWLDGQSASVETVADPGQAARDLAAFILALRGIDATGGPRLAALEARDAKTRHCIAQLEGEIDAVAALRVWDEALQAPFFDGVVWVHADLHPANLLLRGGCIRAVIDFGALGVGDPAWDMMIAWTLFHGESRRVFRAALAADDAAWSRARGMTLSKAAIALPYYRDTNPPMVAFARHAIAEALAEP